MIDLTGILIIAVYVIVILIAWNLFKTVAKVFFTALSLTFILFAVFGVLLYLDAKDMRENIDEGILVLAADDSIAAGILIKGQEPLPVTPLETYSEHYMQNDLENLIGDNYKMFILTRESLKTIEPFTLDIAGKEIQSETAISALYSTNPSQALFGDVVGISDEELKTFILATLYGNHVAKDPLFMINEFKNERIVIYPETAIFKTMRYVPTSFMKSIFDRIIQAGKETAQDAFETGKERAGEIMDQAKEAKVVETITG